MGSVPSKVLDLELQFKSSAGMFHLHQIPLSLVYYMVHQINLAIQALSHSPMVSHIEAFL